MDKMKKLAVAAGLAVAAAGFAGCASTRVAEPVQMDTLPAQGEARMVSRPLPSYGSMGGYRYRRFAAVAAS